MPVQNKQIGGSPSPSINANVKKEQGNQIPTTNPNQALNEKFTRHPYKSGE